MTRSINAAGLDLIRSFEGFCAHPYQDSARIWTIGYGHTDDVTSHSLPVTEVQAENLLREDLVDAEDIVQRQIHVPLTDNQYAALVSLVYNAGIAPLARTLGNVLNARNYAAAADEFLRWNHVSGVVSDGLTRRREAERELFLSSDERRESSG